MSQRSDMEADKLLEGLSTRGIYHLAWTLLMARIGIGLAIGVFGIGFALVMGTLLGLLFRLTGTGG